MNFTSDTSAPAHPAVIEALASVNIGMEASYGGDGFPLSALSRWQERIVAPGGWSL